MTTKDVLISGVGELRKNVSLKVFGVGGAGCNAVELMAQNQFLGVQFAAINTDIQSLLDLSVECVMPLGANLTRGLGAGGDPEIGRAAAEEDAGQLRKLCAGAEVVVIVTGLGGGTGTGASPVLARAASDGGALVLAIAALPFDCEGTRRRRQAQEGLEELKEAADAVICLSNQRVLQLIDENTSLIETFKVTNDLLVQGLRGLWRLLSRTGTINADFADLCASVRGQHAESSFACVEAQGEQRAREIAEKLLAHSLLDGGSVLNDASSVLVSLVGGSSLTMAEVNRVMTQLNRACENAHVIMGAAIEPELGDRLSATVIATRRSRPEAEKPAGIPGSRLPVEVDNTRRMEPVAENATDGAANLGAEFFGKSQAIRPPSRFIAPPPELCPDKKEQLLAQQSGKAYRKPRSKLRQGVLPLEILSRGRFEKSEPTVYHGEDLDVPTYIRRGVPLN